ncbi:MAG TPA: hypothetical protein VFJ56_01160 [Nitrospira sp.]|nr:hypothetical protein [Nitrospira sp.]
MPARPSMCDPPKMQGYHGKSGSYVWPQTLRLPPRPLKVVYLDLNHWVALAKAMAGHSDGEASADVLTGCLSALERGGVAFPISDSIYFEISKIRLHRQRRDLLEVIEAMSRFMVVTSRSVVSAHEIEALLDRVAGPNPKPIRSMNYLDWGVARALGMVGGFKVRSSSGEDLTAAVRDAHPDGPGAFDRLLAKAELELNRNVIAGPAPDKEADLRKLGWNPTGGFEVAERRVTQEIEQVRRFDEDPRWRRGRIRDVVAAREVLIEINDALFRGLSERGATLETIFPRLADTRHALDSMPSFDVAVTLKTAYHRDPMHRWTPNDIHDIDAMGSALPYCDIVVTDKAVASHAKRTKLAQRLDTIVLWRLSDLLQHL